MSVAETVGFMTIAFTAGLGVFAFGVWSGFKLASKAIEEAVDQLLRARGEKDDEEEEE